MQFFISDFMRISHLMKYFLKAYFNNSSYLYYSYSNIFKYSYCWTFKLLQKLRTFPVWLLSKICLFPMCQCTCLFRVLVTQSVLTVYFHFLSLPAGRSQGVEYSWVKQMFNLNAYSKSYLLQSYKTSWTLREREKASVGRTPIVFQWK